MPELGYFLKPHLLALVAAILVIFFQALYFYLKYSPQKKIVKKIRLFHVKILSTLILAISSLYVVFYKECFASSLSPGTTFAAFSLIIPSLVIIIFSRIQLGIHYSTELEIIETHEYVKKGFYKYVDHPIYYSEFFIALGMFLLLNHFTRYFTLLLVVLELTLKTRAENALLREYFPEEFQSLWDKLKNIFAACSVKMKRSTT